MEGAAIARIVAAMRAALADRRRRPRGRAA
jgi:hypothetical protein